MAVPTPSEVSPWYLRNITQALALDGVTGNVYVRTDIGSGGTINIGNVVVSNVTVDQLGNIDISGTEMPVSIANTIDANVYQGTSPWIVQGNVTATISGTPTVLFSSTQSDAFGRLRVSNPQTLFDTQSRYYDHQQFASNTVGAGNVVYNSNSSTYSLNVGTGSTDSAITETYKVFPYQPGKSLLIFATFCMNEGKTNLRQRVGYFSADNGIFFEVDGTTFNMVIRSKSSGVVVEDRIPQSSWNGDRLTGAGGVNNPSGIELVPELDQIFWTDIEWLGVGSVRVGFVINGTFYTCHTFNHANTPSTANADNTTTYMSTACLPIRYEITNTGVTTGISTLRQVCSSVISEGGYTLSGAPRSIGHNLGAPITLPNDASFKPLLSIRLKSTTPDSIVLPKFYTIAPTGQSTFKYRIYNKLATTTGGSWVSAGSDSPVEYNLGPTAIASGTIVAEGFIISSNQTAGAPVQVSFGFENQLERNSFTGTNYEYVLVAATTGTNQTVYASLEWQEVN